VSQARDANLRDFAPGLTLQVCSDSESLATCGRFEPIILTPEADVSQVWMFVKAQNIVYPKHFASCLLGYSHKSKIHEYHTLSIRKRMKYERKLTK